MCSKRWAKPVRPSGSFRDPTPYQRLTAVHRRGRIRRQHHPQAVAEQVFFDFDHFSPAVRAPYSTVHTLFFAPSRRTRPSGHPFSGPGCAARQPTSHEGDSPLEFTPFQMERWQSTHEHRVDFNLSESGVHPLTLGELLSYARPSVDISSVLLGYSQSNGTDELRSLIASLYPGAHGPLGRRHDRRRRSELRGLLGACPTRQPRRHHASQLHAGPGPDSELPGRGPSLPPPRGERLAPPIWTSWNRRSRPAPASFW